MNPHTCTNHGCGRCCVSRSCNKGCHNNTDNLLFEGDEFVQALTFTIEGMSCKHCVARATQALENVPGVTSVEIDLSTKMASVFGENLVEAKLFEAVNDMGYTAK